MSHPIVNALQNYLNDKSSFNKKDILKIASDAFDDYRENHKKVAKEKKVVEKKEKVPTAYQIFMKEKMKELKEQGVKPREAMTMIGKMWESEKNN
jgi:AmiR/NasT family two-component response regulator